MEVVGSMVTLPLSKEPTLLWGLGIRDILWIVVGFTLDVLVWHMSHGHLMGWTVDIVISAIALAMAWIKIEGLTLAHWLWLITRFLVLPKLFLPQ